MEALYAALQEQIQSFEEHIRSCQKAFDLNTLYYALLLLLPESCGSKDVQSLEQLEALVESRRWDREDTVTMTAGKDKYDLHSYVSWFLSYVRYLGSLKEMFDTKVVFPLCSNLYVNDDSLDALPMKASKENCLPTRTSVAHIAKHLFAIRSQWALLLKGGRIDERAFGAQSLLDWKVFPNSCNFMKVLRLVPDLFNKSLTTAELARQWIQCHASRYSSHPTRTGFGATKMCNDTGLAVNALKHHWDHAPFGHPELLSRQNNCIAVRPCSKASSGESGDSHICATGERRNKLYGLYGELKALLGRKERAWALETELQEVNQNISHLQSQQMAQERELGSLEHPLEKENWNLPSTQHQMVLRELDALGRQLRLEEYRKRILQGYCLAADFWELPEHVKKDKDQVCSELLEVPTETISHAPRQTCSYKNVAWRLQGY